MKISEAIGEVKPLKVTFPGGAVLDISYQPPAYTVAQLEEAAADKENPDRLIKMIQQLVVAWDLTDNEDVPIDLGNFEQIKKNVPLPVYQAIVKAIREDNSVGEA